MKILYLIDSLRAGGKERQLVELLKGIKMQDNIIVRLVVLSDAIDYGYINSLDLDMHILKRKYRKDVSILGKLYRICDNFKPDIIHSWELMCSMYSLPIAKMSGIKFINGIIRYAPSEFGILTKKWLTIKLTFAFSDINLSNSYAGLKSFGAPHGKSYCIHNGFDLGRLENLQSRESIRSKYGIVTDNVVGMVARFDERKDYYSFIKSAVNILNRRRNVTFVAVGSGETLGKCVGLVPAEYIEHIRFLGKQNDVESIVNIFDVGVLASKEEGISNSIMEYMALEKPVVATMHGGNNELVENAETGLLVRHGDIEDLTKKIEFLLENKDIAIAMGRAGKKRLENEFNVERMTSDHIKLYKRLLYGQRDYGA